MDSRDPGDACQRPGAWPTWVEVDMSHDTRACMQCTAPLTGRQQKHCSPLCARRAYSAARTADGRLAALRKQRAPQIAEYNRENHRRWWVQRTCVACGGTWLTPHRDAKICSPACRERAMAAGLIEKRPPSRRARKAAQMRRAARGRRGSTWAQGTCNQCGVAFVTRLCGDLPSYCSDRCQQRSKGSRRRARSYGAERQPYSRMAIFTRDQWRCHICRTKTDRRRTTPHPRAPTIDHLVPLSLGGADTAANVATACFRCNSHKRELGGGEQLALIG